MPSEGAALHSSNPVGDAHADEFGCRFVPYDPRFRFGRTK
jgi:hypothetical protein